MQNIMFSQSKLGQSLSLFLKDTTLGQIDDHMTETVGIFKNKLLQYTKSHIELKLKDITYDVKISIELTIHHQLKITINPDLIIRIGLNIQGDYTYNCCMDQMKSEFKHVSDENSIIGLALEQIKKYIGVLAK